MSTADWVPPVFDVSSGTISTTTKTTSSSSSASDLIAALSSTATPLVILRNHPLVSDIRAYASKTFSTNDPTSDHQYKISVDDPQIGESFRALAQSILCLLTDRSDSDVKVEGTMSTRVYPPHEDEQRLGPHVDNTTLTLLWATEPGLQVPVPGSIRPDQVAGFGVPSLTGEFVFLREDQWVTVPSTPDDIILTLGLEFFTAFSDVAERAKILSPALHRVKRAGTNSKTTRLSVPYLCRLVT
eukprot:CAMPEP_0182479744 /NCGR_PEP_ID=MMETSP1319-20130603/34689_1 /TAXON_ID=172717 /ORGANISM="Bolidomonas pacifica, Strain RCC208" /LENGTH=241 /DNA_ID=CAMNT_0024681181 /DNA_START=76 /DNA_END=797 /DNA_ORIENTATION=-